jgi:plastocyanin
VRWRAQTTSRGPQNLPVRDIPSQATGNPCIPDAPSQREKALAHALLLPPATFAGRHCYMHVRLTILMLTAACAASAASLNGTIEDRALRTKTQLVFLESVPGKFAPPADPAVMNQIGNQYQPHLLPVLVGTKVSFTSLDPELHNVYARAGKKAMFNQAVLTKQKFEKTFNEPGVVHLSCNIHKEMSADIVVLQNPFWAKTDPKTGGFQIRNVPPGKYVLRVWGEGMNDAQKARKFDVTVGGADTALKLAMVTP